MKTDSSKNNQEQEKKNQENNRSKPFNTYSQYLKYSGLAIQMAIMVAIGYWLGKMIDTWMQNTYPIFMIIMIFLFLSTAIYSLIKNLPKD